MKNIKEAAFTKDLMRTFKQLKNSRAESVAEDVEIIYKRKIEDLCHKIRSMDRDRENIILDLSPVNAFAGNVVPSDFNPESFLTKDIQIGLNRRAAVIELQIVVDRYRALFGEYADMKTVEAALSSENLIKRSEVICENDPAEELEEVLD